MHKTAIKFSLLLNSKRLKDYWLINLLLTDNNNVCAAHLTAATYYPIIKSIIQHKHQTVSAFLSDG